MLKLPNFEPITQIGLYVDQLFEKALRSAVTDIHLEAYVGDFRIRFKQGGRFKTEVVLSKHLAPLFLNRIKALANLDINERRTPQDGQFEFHPSTVSLSSGMPPSSAEPRRTILMRVSSIPTYRGESLAIRILDSSLLHRSLHELGMSVSTYNALKLALKQPNGLIIIGGATGSGKTTTLYALLKELDATKQKILTVEDPIEYTLPGVVQVSVCPPIGLTFAHCLRSFLRQDPDVIAVGEIRDLETAKTALQAALTGHLIISTLHAGNFAEAIARFRQFGLEACLLKACLRSMIHQRLSYVPSPTGAEAACVAFKLLQGNPLTDLIQQWDQHT